MALGGSHTLVLCHNAAIKRKALLDLQEVDTQMYHQEPQVEAVPDPPKSPINHIEKEAILVNDEELEELRCCRGRDRKRPLKHQNVTKGL